MISKKKILSILPEFKNSEIVLKKKQGVEDIVKGILKTHNQYFIDYDLISDFFYKGDIEDSCKYIFDFLKVKTCLLIYKIKVFYIINNQPSTLVALNFAIAHFIFKIY